MRETYWDKVMKGRATRRRALAASSTGLASAFLLAACGGGGDDQGRNGARDNSGTGATGTSSLVTDPNDTSSVAKRGGTLKWYVSSEPQHFDGGTQAQVNLNTVHALAYSSLVQNKPGYLGPSSYTEVIPGLAEDWEISPDGLQITFNLRRDVKWHNIPPVSGRPFDASDVVANWNRYEAKGGNREGNANSINPNAPIVSVTSTDDYTVVYKLNRPTSFMLQRLALMRTGEAGTIMPKEADNGFDPKFEQIGTGGFMRERFEPSVGLTYKRNPDYWENKEPYIDTLELPIIPEPSSALAQLKAGNLYTYPVPPTDVLAVKQETPDIDLYKSIESLVNPGPIIGFGWNPLSSGEKSPFLDVRVRQALALSFDREIFIDTFGNLSMFESNGLPVDTHHFTCMGYVPGVLLDPRDEEKFGENARYYRYNPDEAKKLLSAAYPDGMPEFPSRRIAGRPVFGPTHADEVEVLDMMARDVGFKPMAMPIDYTQEYLPQIVTTQGQFDGWAYRWGSSSSPDPVDFFVWRYWSKSGPTSGALGFGGPDGSLGDQSGDPEVDALIERSMAETDSQARVQIIHDLQRMLAKQQYGVSRPGISSEFAAAWPVIANYQVFQNDSRSTSGTYTWWIDKSKAPLI